MKYYVYMYAGYTYDFSLCSTEGGSASYDSYLIIYNSSCSSVSTNDDYCGLQSRIPSYVCPSTGVYYLEINSCCTGGSSGSYTLAYRHTAPSLPGDNCSNAENLATLSSPYSATTVAYTKDIPVCRTGYPDRIFYISVPNGYTVDIWQSVNNFDSYHYMGYGGSCPGTTTIYCVDDPDDQHNAWTNSTGSTQTVWFIVDGYSGSGTFTLNWTLSAPSYPDLQILDIWSSPDPPTAGTAFTYFATVYNAGASAAGASYVGFYVNGSYVGEYYLSSLAAYTSTTVSISANWGSSGSYSAMATADYYGWVTESNEGNNSRSETWTLNPSTQCYSWGLLIWLVYANNELGYTFSICIGRRKLG
jgi:hypothetical protein